jgi:hypothetical protein
VAWQRRDPSVFPFLGETLHDRREEVWQEALAGLVGFGSSAALEVLRFARTCKFIDESETKRFRRWLEEAIQYLEERVRA